MATVGVAMLTDLLPAVMSADSVWSDTPYKWTLH
jgi:hypothetical protein